MDAFTPSTPSLYGKPPHWHAAVRRFRTVVFVVMCGWVASAVDSLVAQTHDSYEDLAVTWELADHDCAARILQHERTLTAAHSGQTSELVRLQAGSGTYIHLVTPLATSQIIDELTITVWVKSNRPGLQLAARAVLPRSNDPRTGSVLTTLIRGTTYQQPEKWEKLAIELPFTLLNRQVPLLRSQFGSDVDPREAYIDMLVLNAYGGAGTTDLWIDDLEVTGQVDMSGTSGPGSGSSASPRAPAAIGPSRTAPAPTLQASVLTIDGTPRLLRAIDHNGEPLAWLKSIGFNAVCLTAPASAELLREAEESGMWLVAPPPTNQSPIEYGTGLQRVLAWDLGRDLTADQVEMTRRLAQQLRSVPDEAKRAIICQSREETWQYSRFADMAVLEPPGPNSSLPLSEFGSWHLQRSRLLRMGSHFWASIPTEIHPSIVQQLALLDNSGQTPLSLEPEQIELLVYHAIASGARGLLFRSQSRLDGTDRLAELRANVLQRLNQELQLIEPWAATGEHEGELETNDPAVRASVLATNRSRLLILIRRTADQQYVAGPIDSHPVTVEVPRVPDNDEVYQVGEDGLRRITQQRGAGVRISLDKPRLVTTIVLTQDPLVVNFLATRTAALRQGQDQLMGAIAGQMYAAVVETHQQLLTLIPAAGLSSATIEGQSLSLARHELQQFQRLVEGGGHERAYEFLQRGSQQLALTRYQDWQLASGVFPSPVSSPLCVNFFALPQHYKLGQRLQGASWGPNSLAGGDFENLSLLQSSGWKNVARHTPDLATTVELSLHSPHSGRSALRLQCWPVNSNEAPLVIESPPLAITTAPVRVRHGQLIRIHGWARVPAPIQGSLDGLLIYDSITGLQLADRIQPSESWREFSLYRLAPREGTVDVTIALSGLGEAWVDDMTINVLSPPASQAQRPHGSSVQPRR